MKYDPQFYPTCTVPAPEVTRVKGLGCLRDKLTPDCFNCRVITRNGKISGEEMTAIANAAIQFGSGEVAFTTRQTAEIQRVPYDKLENLFSYLARHGLETGGTGAKVRPIVSCKGTTCVFGLIDTYALSLRLHKQLYVGYRSVRLPHKFKIAVGGCANNCVKPDLNDVGIVGAWKPQLVADKCRGCGACVKACPVGVATLKNGQFANTDQCNQCGRCVRACKLGGLEYTGGYRVAIGGRWGKRVARGQFLSPIFETEDQVISTVEKVLLFFRAYGHAGERLADTVARIGFEKAQRLILSDELLQRKAEILEAPL